MTGIFGGSFNPIHLGHTGLAQWIVQQGYADEVWLMVSPQNPLKEENSLLPEKQRFSLAITAVRHIANVKASDFEFHLPRPSYTWQTLQALEEAYPTQEFALIIGADNWLCFDKWKNYKKIVENYKILIYPREGYDITSALPENVTLMNAPLFRFCSTDVRRRLIKGEDVSEMIDRKVHERILSEHLYETYRHNTTKNK